MITYNQFNEIWSKLDPKRVPEIEIYFKDNEKIYMIIKSENKIKFGLENKLNATIYEFVTLDELYNAKVIDGNSLKNLWSLIEDILIDNTFSVIYDKEYFKNVYSLEL